MEYEITTRRENGKIEITTTEKFGKINAQIWEKIKAATKAAGKGDCLSYKNLTPRPVFNPDEKAQCWSCGTWGRLGDMEMVGAKAYHRGCFEF